MADSTSRAAPQKSSLARHAWRTLTGVFVATVMAVPFVLINRGFALMTRDMDGTFHGLVWFFALMGISLLFLQIALGAFRPILRRVFTASGLAQFHKGFGVAGFACIACHFLFLLHSIGEHWAAVNHGFFLLGPLTLFVLTGTVSTALARGRIGPPVWFRLHVLNYVVFVAGAIHGLGIGTQTSTPAARLVFAFYLLVAATGLAYRASSPVWRRRLAPVARPGTRTRR